MFGFDDGEAKIQTIFIGRSLQNAGYDVGYFWWRPHNMIIYSIRKDGIGYSDPIDYLPIKILELLEDQFPTRILFR